MARFGIGQSARRKEDDALLTGKGVFQDDVALDGEAHACFVRAPHAHAEIAAIDAAAARESAGVLAVYTSADADADGLGTLPCTADAFVALTRPDGSPACYPPNPMLARARVRHVGEAVAMVVAETRDAARDAAERVTVDYRPLPAVVDAAEARAAGAPQLWAEAPGNLSCAWEQGDRAATDAAFAAADRAVDIELVNNRVIVNTIEPRGALGAYDPATGRYTLHTNSQHVFGTRQIVAGILGIGEDRLRVLSHDLGGGFGMKYFTYPEQVLVAWAARRLGRPVRWLSGRAEGFVSDTQARDHVTQAALALDGAGRFLGLRVRTLCNLGAYVSNLGPISPTLLYTRMLANAYRTPAIHAEVEGVLTNTLFTDAYRGAGIPEANYVVERLADKAAAALGLSPGEMRRRNVIPAGAMPYRVPLDLVYDSGDYARNLEDGMALADWRGFPARRAGSAARGRLRGIGMAVYVESTVGDPSEHVAIRFGADDRVTLLAGTRASGQGHATTYAQLLGETLGIPFEAVDVIEGDSDDLPAGGGTGGSRSTYMAALAIEDGAAKVIEKGRRLAADLLEAAPADIRFADGRFSIAGTDRAIEIMALAARAREARAPAGEEAPGLDSEGRAETADGTFPNGCHVCEVEVDPETGAVTIAGYAAVNDFGRIVNPLLVDGQVHGGVAQGLGQAVFENCVYDARSGQLLSGSFMDYCLPRADDLPPFALATNDAPTAQNPFGIKGCGEAGAIPAPAAAVNAVLDALKERGVTHLDMPLTPERIWRALAAARPHRRPTTEGTTG